MLHEFFVPYLAELADLLDEYDFPPMRWNTGRTDRFKCRDKYQFWRGRKGKPIAPPEPGAAAAPPASSTVARSTGASKPAARAVHADE